MPPAKKSGRALLREEGLERTDNNLKSHTWPIVQMINQKNYYTFVLTVLPLVQLLNESCREYLKREDQVMVYRQQQEESVKAALQQAKDKSMDGDTMDVDEEGEKEEEMLGSKVIVIHPGSQNLRIGLASDALPRSVPMVIARRSDKAEFEVGPPYPNRKKADAGENGEEEEEQEEEPMFGPEFSHQLREMSTELKQRMRNNKRRILPNSKDLVISYNNRTAAEVVKEHNDPNRVEWTEVPQDSPPEYYVGKEALRIPDISKPRYRLLWPIRHGWLNEKDYNNKRKLLADISVILEEGMRTELGIAKRDIRGTYSAVLVIPDLYEKVYVNEMLELLFKDFFFEQVCIIQESLAASFGAGFSQACIVDIGAQKTSVCCVEEGMCVVESRLNLKYGGADVTNTFIKALLVSQFPYRDINLWRRYDYLLAEELKLKYYTLNDAVISVQVCDFHLRAPGSDTKKYSFKCYDEVMIAPMGYFNPKIFDHSYKLEGRRSLLERSYDIYDGKPDDPISTAQLTLYQASRPSSNGNASVNEVGADGGAATPVNSLLLTPAKAPTLNPFSHINLETTAATPRSSIAGSPAPEGTPIFGASTPAFNFGGPVPFSHVVPIGPTPLELAEERDKQVPVCPLDQAIVESITHASKGDEKKIKEYLGSIMIVGGGSQVAGLNHLLEERLRGMKRYSDFNVMVAPPPRELDPQVIVWKGSSVFGKLKSTNDSWIRAAEYDILGSRLLAYRCLWLY
ncbi:actin-like ATPase domain-containing protein [Terfezia boudieri ATCC MYA-4762]|uniref:Actin-like ATPase domain-containing protein n=1 Tax=Terfezia boudieri ATCC MYA-4762 TaxID=1051890 RepID=A0A3N4LGD1_9PEZI|nr:actin-like ATPase domain-containing protein [Terfezia boudieri ATCC MYA-4762]